MVDVRPLNRILRITDDTVTVEPGALYIDVAKELERRGLQFNVNIELGNLSLGAAAMCATKDASMPGELGQVNSYAIGVKLVTPSGELVEVTRTTRSCSGRRVRATGFSASRSRSRSGFGPCRRWRSTTRSFDWRSSSAGCRS